MKDWMCRQTQKYHESQLHLVRLKKFSHLEHKENVATALEVCIQVGVDKGSALEGMLKTQPDPGALFIKKIQFGANHNFFVNAFAANDPLSTLNIWKMIKKQIPLYSTCVFLNTRVDRRSRTDQMITLVSKTIQPDIFLIRGNKLPEIPAGLFKRMYRGFELLSNNFTKAMIVKRSNVVVIHPRMVHVPTLGHVDRLGLIHQGYQAASVAVPRIRSHLEKIKQQSSRVKG